MSTRSPIIVLVLMGGLLGAVTEQILKRATLAQDTKPAETPTAGTSVVLPSPPSPFHGDINLRAKQSTPDFPQPAQAPKNAPNVLLVLLDDVGFGAPSTFGGPCATPNLQKIG